LRPPYFQLTSLLPSLLLLESLLLLAFPLLLESADVYSFPGIPFCCAVAAVSASLLLLASLLQPALLLLFASLFLLVSVLEVNVSSLPDYFCQQNMKTAVLSNIGKIVGYPALQAGRSLKPDHTQKKSIKIVALLHVIFIALQDRMITLHFHNIANRIHDYMRTAA
jgi:hypothetical protein